MKVDIVSKNFILALSSRAIPVPLMRKFTMNNICHSNGQHTAQESRLKIKTGGSTTTWLHHTITLLICECPDYPSRRRCERVSSANIQLLFGIENRALKSDIKSKLGSSSLQFYSVVSPSLPLFFATRLETAGDVMKLLWAGRNEMHMRNGL